MSCGSLPTLHLAQRVTLASPYLLKTVNLPQKPPFAPLCCANITHCEILVANKHNLTGEPLMCTPERMPLIRLRYIQPGVGILRTCKELLHNSFRLVSSNVPPPFLLAEALDQDDIVSHTGIRIKVSCSIYVVFHPEVNSQSFAERVQYKVALVKVLVGKVHFSPAQGKEDVLTVPTRTHHNPPDTSEMPRQGQVIWLGFLRRKSRIIPKDDEMVPNHTLTQATVTFPLLLRAFYTPLQVWMLVFGSQSRKNVSDSVGVGIKGVCQIDNTSTVRRPHIKPEVTSFTKESVVEPVLRFQVL